MSRPTPSSLLGEDRLPTLRLAPARAGTGGRSGVPGEAQPEASTSDTDTWPARRPASTCGVTDAQAEQHPVAPPVINAFVAGQEQLADATHRPCG